MEFEDGRCMELARDRNTLRILVSAVFNLLQR